MHIRDLLVQCEGYGVTLTRVDHDKLCIRPASALPSDVKALVRRYKWDILRYLDAPPQHGCYTCQQRQFWQHAATYRWICATCHPAPHPELIEAVHEAPELAVPWMGVSGQPSREESFQHASD